MKKTESVVQEKCGNCGFENDLGCEVWSVPHCSKCDQSLEVDMVVEYLDCCPLCNLNFELATPMSFYQSNSGVYLWLCNDCEDSPRGFFVVDYEFRTAEKPLPCAKCGSISKYIYLTHENHDGIFICEECNSKDQEGKMLAEHRAVLEE